MKRNHFPFATNAPVPNAIGARKAHEADSSAQLDLEVVS